MSISRLNIRPRTGSSLGVVVVLCALVGAHRVVLWRMFGGRIDALAAANPDWLTWQFLSLDAYRDHLATALLYLQQTPPVPSVVFGIVAKLAEWPVGVAHWLYLLQAAISAATVGLLYLLLRRLRCGRLIGFTACLWFGLSSDLYVMEINSFGQLFYESGAMLFALGACYCLIEAYGRRSDGATTAANWAFAAGILIALSALTRASYSLFAVPTVGFAALFLGLRRTAIMLLPILLLHGGWSLKNELVYGYFSPSTSSWAGLNATVSMDDALQAEFVDAIKTGDAGVAPWVVKLMKDKGYVAWSPPVPPDLLPPGVADQQRRIQAAMGGTNNPENSVSVQRLSFAYLKALRPFILAHLGAFGDKLAEGYAVFWQPIADYSAMFIGPVSTLPQEHEVWLRTPLSIVRPAQVMTGTFPNVSQTPAVLPALSLDFLDAVSFWSLHLLLPLLLFHDAIMLALRRSRLLTPEMLLLAAVIVYGGILFNAVELGENMRFRLSIEPDIIALSIAILAAAASRLRSLAPEARSSTASRAGIVSTGPLGLPVTGPRRPDKAS